MQVAQLHSLLLAGLSHLYSRQQTGSRARKSGGGGGAQFPQESQGPTWKLLPQAAVVGRNPGLHCLPAGTWLCTLLFLPGALWKGFLALRPQELPFCCHPEEESWELL